MKSILIVLSIVSLSLMSCAEKECSACGSFVDRDECEACSDCYYHFPGTPDNPAGCKRKPAKESEPSMEDLAAKCIEESYDCDCYSNKIRDYFKNDENYAQWAAKSDALPDELIMSLWDCSKQDAFDF